MSDPGLRLVPANGPSDVDALIGRVARGDARAFEALYDELSAAVFGLARRVVRDPSRAEDVTQEVFLEVWRKAARFDSALGKAKTWVLTIAHRRSVDAVRRSEVQKRHDHQVPPDDVSPDEPAERVIRSEEHGAVRECLETLTDLQLESVRLAYFNGYTYNEVATLLDKPLPTIKTRMRDGLIRLRDCLEGGKMSTELHTLSGAYAIDALTSEEAEQFATHLEGCQACRDEVRELQEASARLGASEAIAPPPALKARVLAAADKLPQLPPKVTSTLVARRRRWVAWAGAVAAAIVLVAGGIVGVNQLNHQETPVASGSVSQVFSAPDAKKATVYTTQGPVRVAMSADSGQMAVDTARLHHLSQSRVYQMWAVHNGRPTSVGIIDNPDSGKVMPIPASGTTVAITIEPEGGSKRPTSKAIVDVDPAQV